MEVSKFSRPISAAAQSRLPQNQTEANFAGTAIDRPVRGAGQDLAGSGEGAETATQRFATQLLVAVLNAQGHQGGSSFASGSPRPLGLGSIVAARPAGDQHGYSAIISSAGELQASSLDGKTAEGLADDVVNAFGSGGSLDLSDVERALGIKDSSVDPRILQKIEDVIEEKWSAIAKGSHEVSSDELSSVIRDALGVA